MVWEDDNQSRMVSVCKEVLVAAFVILSRNIKIKTDKYQGYIKVSIGTRTILFEGLREFFQHFWPGGSHCINVQGEHKVFP